MPRIYLDQMALIALGRRKLSAEEAGVRNCIEQGRVTLVLSPAHWVDTAGGSSTQRSRELAQFIDSLRPVWLRERISIHRLEIRCFLEEIQFEQLRERVICKTVSELVADIGGLHAGGTAIVSTTDVVVHLRTSPQARQIFDQAYAQNERAFKVNRRKFRAGLITLDVEQRLHAAYLRRVGGVGAGTPEDDRLQEAPAEALRSIVCEWEATKEGWRQGGVMGRRRLRDLFHLTVAMPYADVILTYDLQMRRTIAAGSRRVSFPVATVVGSMGELLAQTDHLREGGT